MVTRSIPTLVLCAALLTGGCSWQAPHTGDEPARRETVPVAQVQADAPVTGAAVISAPVPAGAAARLLSDALQFRQQGDHERAADSIERALRIERANPWLYLELARVRAAQGRPDQASALLAKARASAGGGDAIEQAIADAARDLQVTVPGL